MWSAAKNMMNKARMGAANMMYAPPDTEQFEVNG
jgi:hypothetical protein